VFGAVHVTLASTASVRKCGDGETAAAARSRRGFSVAVLRANWGPGVDECACRFQNDVSHRLPCCACVRARGSWRETTNGGGDKALGEGFRVAPTAIWGRWPW
jgi:hypothetical protein